MALTTGNSSNEDINDQNKTKQKVPVVNMDLHYYSLRIVNRCIKEGILPEKGNTVIRLDAHNDEIIPGEFSPLYRLRSKSIRENLYPEYGSEVWMKEAIEQFGSLSHVIWIKPPWSLQVEDGHKTIENNVTIDVKTIGKAIFENGQDNFDEFATIFQKYLSPGDPYILDIAFSFFSANNPYNEEYKKCKTYYSLLTELFDIPLPVNNTDEVIEQAVEARYAQLDYLRKIFHYIQTNRCLPSPIEYPPELYKKVVHLRKDLLNFYPDIGIKWDYIYNHGLFASNYLCPVHHTSRENITKMINYLGKLLDILQTPPSVITLGVMYDYDRNTFKNDIDFITKSLEEFFKSRFDIKVEYLDY